MRIDFRMSFRYIKKVNIIEISYLYVFILKSRIKEEARNDLAS
ncbi:hypothetical protein LEP1GSC008_1240 [Leptospira kirschneri serovar Bulgarica str. Nikolaevo]|uniref:Uncharacterized protein n=1 Tax=Leptospira kirschneri serovar Bulgarica str. Nikolaevo TaxID=1240687 RepID=M6EXG9_9LEPT|nr:hypothetical protein LEP1GSC008_1240 [Leptospira kirschneri serovar Bulgarica str. Nikolaevo]